LKNTLPLPVLCLAILGFTAVAAVATSWAGDFKTGAAQVVITPLVGTPIGGGYALRPSNGKLDDLYAKAIVVEQDGAKAAFVGLDVCYTIRPVITAARKLIAEQTCIAPDRVMISATHTHSGPVQTRCNLMDVITGANKPISKEYTAKLPSLIAQAVAEADAKLTPARASAMMAREENVSFNRRYWMKDGTVGWMTGRSPDMVRPAGPIDPDVGVCHFEGTGEKGRPLATYFNFAMHPTVVGGSKFSADYCGAVGRHLSDFKGPGMVTLFANGCCGNLNQINPKWPGQGHGLPEAERIGTVLAAAALRDWHKLQKLDTHAPQARSTLVTLPRRQVTEQEITKARTVVDKIGKAKQTIPTMANAVCIMESAEKQNVPLEAEVQVIAFSNDLAIVALPGEIFVELGLALKKASPFQHTFIAELAHGSIGYVPNKSAYLEGNYEVVSARCAAGGGEMLIDAALKLLEELHPPSN
jgi:neutral ceramidase